MTLQIVQPFASGLGILRDELTRSFGRLLSTGRTPRRCRRVVITGDNNSSARRAPLPLCSSSLLLFSLLGPLPSPSAAFFLPGILLLRICPFLWSGFLLGLLVVLVVFLLLSRRFRIEPTGKTSTLTINGALTVVFFCGASFAFSFCGRHREGRRGRATRGHHTGGSDMRLKINQRRTGAPRVNHSRLIPLPRRRRSHCRAHPQPPWLQLTT